MQVMASNPIPSHVNHGFQNKSHTSKIEYSYNIYLKIMEYNIETINYKNKNPQVNLMGSNPTPRVLLVKSYLEH
jgi:hypothetical protein